MTERGTYGEQPRHNIDHLRREIADGANIYGVIGGVLDKEAQMLYEFRGGRLPNLPFDSSRLGLRDLPGEKEPSHDLFSPNDVGCVSGFSYVAAHFYPLVGRASKYAGGLTPLPKHIEEIMSASEKERAIFAKEIANKPLFRAIVSGELEDSLTRDPSGATWLDASVTEEFKDAGKELIGARRAVMAAKTLYALLK